MVGKSNGGGVVTEPWMKSCTVHIVYIPVLTIKPSLWSLILLHNLPWQNSWWPFTAEQWVKKLSKSLKTAYKGFALLQCLLLKHKVCPLRRFWYCKWQVNLIFILSTRKYFHNWICYFVEWSLTFSCEKVHTYSGSVSMTQFLLITIENIVFLLKFYFFSSVHWFFLSIIVRYFNSTCTV